METWFLPGASRRWRIALLVPPALALACSLYAQPERISFAAPLLGPWAGYLYGHRDCTMAVQYPSLSVAVPVLGILALAVSTRIRPGPARVAVSVLLVTLSFAWSALAAMSVANTTE